MTAPDPVVAECPCDCFECRVDRHDICRHLIKCIKRPARQYDPEEVL